MNVATSRNGVGCVWHWRTSFSFLNLIDSLPHENRRSFDWMGKQFCIYRFQMVLQKRKTGIYRLCFSSAEILACLHLLTYFDVYKAMHIFGGMWYPMQVVLNSILIRFVMSCNSYSSLFSLLLGCCKSWASEISRTFFFNVLPSLAWRWTSMC